MSREAKDTNQRIVPYLTYADAPSALDFLCRAFGFVERMRYPMPDGRIGHAEIVYEGNVLMLASAFEGFGESPSKLANIHCQLYCYVDDVEAHFHRAREAGATIVSEPKSDHGHLAYRAMDLEGHRWNFVTKP